MQKQTTTSTKYHYDPFTPGEYNNLIETIDDNAQDFEDRMVEIGPPAPSYQDRNTVIQDTNTSNIKKYTTSQLPTGLTNGTIAYDLNAEIPVYTKFNQWFRITDEVDIHSLTEVDLFIVMGDSNADGEADINTLDPSLATKDRSGIVSNVSTIDEITKELILGSWAQMNPSDPENNTSTSDGKFGPELGFVDTVKNIVDQGGNNLYSKTPAILKFVKKDSSLNIDWDKEGDVFKAMKDALPDSKFELGQSGYRFNVRGLIWYQGKSDTESQTDSEAYRRNLFTFIDKVRSELYSPDLPVMICKIAYEDGSENLPEYVESVRNGQQEVADGRHNVNIVDLQGSYTYGNEGIYLDSGGMYNLGIDIANNFLHLEGYSV